MTSGKGLESWALVKNVILEEGRAYMRRLLPFNGDCYLSVACKFLEGVFQSNTIVRQRVSLPELL